MLLFMVPVLASAQTDTIATETILLDETPLPGQISSGSFIGLINGQNIPATYIQYKTPLFKPRYFLVNDSMRIAADQVYRYQDETGYYERISLERSNQEFAKRESTGRISKFYTARTSYDPGYSYGYGYGPYGAGYPRVRYTYYFSKDGQPLQSLNYKNLKVALADNAGSMASLHRYKRSKNIETGLFVAGAGLLIGGMVATLNDLNSPDNRSTNVSPAVYAGLIVVNVPWIIRLFEKDRMEEAIQLYNYQIK